MRSYQEKTRYLWFSSNWRRKASQIFLSMMPSSKIEQKHFSYLRNVHEEITHIIHQYQLQSRISIRALWRAVAQVQEANLIAQSMEPSRSDPDVRIDISCAQEKETTYSIHVIAKIERIDIPTQNWPSLSCRQVGWDFRSRRDVPIGICTMEGNPLVRTICHDSWQIVVRIDGKEIEIWSRTERMF